MPDNLVKIKDLTDLQVAEIRKGVVKGAELTPFWDKFTTHRSYEPNRNSVQTKALIYDNLTPEDLVNVEEGVTPPPSKLQYATLEYRTATFGDWIGYTDESVRHGFSDVVEDATTTLGMNANEQLELRKARAFVSGTSVVSYKGSILDTLLQNRVILQKNGVKPVKDGKYIAVLTPEHSIQVLKDHAHELQQTSQKEALIEGFIGSLAGFYIYENANPFMYKQSGTPGQPAEAGYIIVFGKDGRGRLPVETIEIGSSAVEVYNNPLGSTPQYSADKGTIYPDALHQRGSVGYKVQGFGVAIVAEEALLRCEAPLTEITEGVKPAIEDADGFVSKSTSPAE